MSGTIAVSIFDNEIRRYATVAGVQLALPGGAVNIEGFGEDLKSRFTSRSISGDFEAGYKLQVGALELTPFAGIQFSALRSDAYSETLANGGMSLIGLAQAERAIASLPTVLGVQLRSQVELGENMQLSGWARAAWRHEWMPDRSTENSFLAAPGFNFVVNGAQPASDTLRASLGARLTLDQNISVSTNFDGDFSRLGSGYTGSVGFRVRW